MRQAALKLIEQLVQDWYVSKEDRRKRMESITALAAEKKREAQDLRSARNAEGQKE